MFSTKDGIEKLIETGRPDLRKRLQLTDSAKSMILINSFNPMPKGNGNSNIIMVRNLDKGSNNDS